MATTDEYSNNNKCNGKYCDPYDERYNTHWEAKPIRPYKTKDEYLYAMREDLTEWLNDLYSLKISPETFFDSLDNGVLLCKHGNRVQRLALQFRQLNNVINNTGMDFKTGEIKYRASAKSGTFQARDNISNFIHWCRTCLKINSVLMFETDDLVLRKNDRSFILCLLEVARRGGLVGMPVPLLVQFEREIDRELNGETPSEPDSLGSTDSSNPSSATATDIEPESPSEADSEGRSMDTSPEPPVGKMSRTRSSIPKRLPFTPQRQPKNINEEREEEEPEEYVQVRLSEEILKTLDERVRDLVNLCTCPNQFPMIREAEGKYKIGDSQTLIFVRILRNHVMVRVGGGWDTLEHYLDKHDPCRCQAHKGGNVTRSRSIPRSGGPYADISPRRASYQGVSNRPKSFKSDSTSANDSDETESVKSLPSKSTVEKYRPTTLQLPSRSSARNNQHHMSPTEGSLSSDSQTPSSEASSKFEESFSGRTRLTPARQEKQCRSAPGSPRMGRKSRLAIPKSKPPSSATEEFLKKKREAQRKVSAGSRIRSAPSSPTRNRSLPSELAKYDNPPSELLKRVTGANGGQPKLSRSPSRQSRGATTHGRLSVGSRERSLSPAVRSSPLRKAASFTAKDKENIMLYIKRDSAGRHRLDSNSSCDSVESLKDKSKDTIKAESKQKVFSPSKRLINSQKSKRSVSSGRTGYHSRDNSLERNFSNNNKNLTARSKSLCRNDGPTERRRVSLPRDENFFKTPRKPRSRSNSFCSEPGDLDMLQCRSGRTSPTDSIKSNSSTKSLSRLRPVTPVPSNMKVDTEVVTPMRKDEALGPPSKIPMPVQHKRLMEQQQLQVENLRTGVASMMSWLNTRSYDHAGSGSADQYTLSHSPTSRESTSPTPSMKSDLHHDSGFEDNAHYRVTSPLGSVTSPNTP